MVGTMIASEVPMHSCMRTSSGTPSTRNTSNSTGTMTAPPPIPNSPARMPVTIPAVITAAASQTRSPAGIAMSLGIPAQLARRRRGAV